MVNSKAGVPASIWNRKFICTLLSSFTLAVADFSINPLIASYAVHLGASRFRMISSSVTNITFNPTTEAKWIIGAFP